MIRSRQLVLFAVVVVAGCGGPSPSPSGDPSTTPTEAPPASTAAATASPASTTTAGAATELPAAGPLEAGTYTRSAFRPPITFAVGDGWSVGSAANGFFDVQQRSGTPEVIAVQFARVDGAIGADGEAVPPGSAADAAAAIRSNPGLDVVEESESRLGGQTGVVIEVENTRAAHAPILDVPAGRLGIDPGRRLWIALFDTPDGLLAVMVGGAAADWEGALGVAEPVLESVLIGGS